MLILRQAQESKHDVSSSLKSLFDKLRVTSAILFTLLSSPVFAQEACDDIPAYYDLILAEVSKKNPQAISALQDCFKRDRTLILKASLLDPTQFQNADESLQEDETFILRLLKISPEVLQFAAPEVRSNAAFMEKATYLNRHALQYASWTLLDNKLFMRRMITIDSLNYKFASDRLKSLPENASRAFADNGLLLEFAPQKIKEDKNLVKIAIGSNGSALAFASDSLKEDKELKRLAKTESLIKSAEELQKFLQENYLVNAEKKELGKIVGNHAKFFRKNILLQHNYVTKWQKVPDGRRENFRLIAATSRNYQTPWREDFKKYPDLIKKIEKFFLSHNVAENTIENLSTTFLWKIKNEPATFAFNLYLLRDSTDEGLGPEFVDATSLTAIVARRKSKWEMTVIEVIFDSEEKTKISYEDGLRHYVLWDLYTVNKKDKNPKIIFKVTDAFGEHFEIFEEEKGRKYQKVLSLSVK